MSNVMNRDCEGCTFKLGHRCDCTNSICINNSEYTTNEEDNNMDIDKKYDMLQKAFDSAIEEINSLKKELEELKQSEKQDDILARYNKFFGEQDRCRTYWYLDQYSTAESLTATMYNRFDTDYNSYRMYLSEDFANTAARMKKFNDMLLAFKWCYDREYKSTYTTDNNKWHIYYNVRNSIYSYDDICNCIEPTIYFSSEVIVKKCCDWLNEIDPNGELVKFD
jgi:hypothetical protein